MDSVYSMNIQSSVTGTLCDGKKKENCKTLNHNLNSVEWIEKKNVMDKKKEEMAIEMTFYRSLAI